MYLRKQIKSSAGMEKEPWTIKQIEAGLRKFFEDNGRYPTAAEIDQYEYLPSVRTLERSFGGLVNVRETLKLSKDYDLRKGSHSSKRAFTINQRNNVLEQEVYTYLLAKFNREFVHREYLFTDDARTKADFFVYDDGKGFCIDVFYPGSVRNLGVCLNIKLQKYKNTGSLLGYPVIFLQMNKEITQETIEGLIERRKSKMPDNYYVMSWDKFNEFCSNRSSLKTLVR